MQTSSDEWVLANHNVVGYYRVNYDEGNWEKLLQILNETHEVRCIISHMDIKNILI